MSFQAVLLALGACGLLASTVWLVRHRLLSIRYGLGWLTLSVLGIVGAPILSILSHRVRSLGFTATGFSLGVLLLFMGLICLQLSVSLSGLHRAMQDLTEHAALTEARLRRLEDAGVETPEQTPR